MNEREWFAMISLLDDEETSPEIKKQVLALGVSAITPLEEIWEKSNDPEVQGKIEEVLQFVQSEIALSELKNWRMKGGKDLLEGWFVISRFRYPKIELETYKKQITRLTNMIWLDMENQRNYHERILSVNYILYKKENFHPEKTNAGNPDRYFLKSFMDSKSGNIFSMSLLYLILTRALELPVTAYIIEGYIALQFSDHNADFFIDAYNHGNLFRREYIERLVTERFPDKTLESYPAASNRMLMALLIEGLIFYYQENNQENKVEYLYRMLDVVK
ncbi:MAG: transglutaminase-like domain-containing protein [Bacteroidia bacterium]|nr:transglutaminase-like domain-containing protein [Bacteroidia bacterium]